MKCVVRFSKGVIMAFQGNRGVSNQIDILRAPTKRFMRFSSGTNKNLLN